MEFLSPLRYPGGKAKVADFVQCLIKENALLDGTYVEPYVGGGSVALSLLFNEYVSDIYINDKDISIYAFWYSVLNNTDALCQLIKDTPINVETWFKQKEFQQNKENRNVDLLNLGFSTFFLNRTNRSGILKAGKPTLSFFRMYIKIVKLSIWFHIKPSGICLCSYRKVHSPV